MSRLPSPGGTSGNNGMKRKNAVMVAFTLPVFLLYIFFFVVVMVLGVYYSMTNWTGIATTYKFIGLQNYVTVLQDTRFWQAIWFNIRYTIMLDIGVILISLLIALALNNLKGKTSTLFRSIFFTPRRAQPGYSGSDLERAVACGPFPPLGRPWASNG